MSHGWSVTLYFHVNLKPVVKHDLYWIGIERHNLVGSFNVNSMDFTSCEHVKISDQVWAVPILECHNHVVVIRELLNWYGLILLNWYGLIQFGWVNPYQFNWFLIILARQDRTCDFNSEIIKFMISWSGIYWIGMEWHNLVESLHVNSLDFGSS